MSFSSDVKKELSSLSLAASESLIEPCCRHAEAYGLLIFGRAFSASAISISTENADVAGLYAQRMAEICGVVPQEYARSAQTLLTFKRAADRRKVLDIFGHSPDAPTLRINRANLADECCFSAFLRGAFLSCGTITSPEKNYHLEFVVPYLRLSNDLFSFLLELSLNPKHIKRKGIHVIYFKDSGAIEDVLTIMGATNSSLELMGVKVNKDLRNHVNRRVNFETANISRAVEAGLAQADAIGKIQRAAGLDSLPERLRETALLRLENPDATLSELEELSGFTVSRSGINHRLNRLMKISEELL
ncbi:MAG: DNA-binding protein WhiA [Oscillospiraceae bacterium]|nr:DNA-binding protein WhiA [Oscillospiraceae bacterium]